MRRKTLFVGLPILLALGMAATGGSTAATAAPGSQTAFNPSLEFQQEPGEEQVGGEQIPNSQKAARVPAAGVPKVGSIPVTSSTPGLGVNFLGLTFAQQRLADNGNQFSVEPPDQALCVGNGFALEAVNDVMRVYTTSGAPASGVVSLNRFFTNDSQIVRSNPPVFGTFLSDPKCYFDPALGRFFFTILGIDQDPATGEFTDNSFIIIAVSKGGTPTTNRADWWFYRISTANADPDADIFGAPGTTGGPKQAAHAGCPCFGDQPLIGADANGFYVSTNEFSLEADVFNGAQLYALWKQGLANGVIKGQAFLNESLPLREGVAYSLQPATSPVPGDWEPANNGTEYLMSALEFGGPDNRIAVWSLSNTASLATTPAVRFNGPAIVTSETYAFPPDAEQPPGPTPLADAAPALLGKPGNGPREHENLISANDDRMQQVVYAGRSTGLAGGNGLLYSGLNTAVKLPNGNTNVGGAYFIVRPASGGTVAAPTLTAAMRAQGYIATNWNNVLYPTAGVGPDGRGAYTFTLVGRDYYPSAAYIRVTPDGVTGPIAIAGRGTRPADGFTGYRVFGGSGVERWGDYFAAQWSDGRVWLASEYIPGTFGFGFGIPGQTVNSPECGCPPFGYLANWGTRVFSVTP